MARTELQTDNIFDGGIKRDDLYVDASNSQSVIRKAIAGTNMNLGSTGVAGTGDVTINTNSAVVFSTSVTTPLLIGGTGTTSSLTLKATTGVGASGSDILFKVGNNGSITVFEANYAGRVSVLSVDARGFRAENKATYLGDAFLSHNQTHIYIEDDAAVNGGQFIYIKADEGTYMAEFESGGGDLVHYSMINDAADGRIKRAKYTALYEIDTPTDFQQYEVPDYLEEEVMVYVNNTYSGSDFEIKLPVSPVDRQRVCISIIGFYTNISLSSDQGFKDSGFSDVAMSNASFDRTFRRFMYDLSSNRWYFMDGFNV